MFRILRKRKSCNLQVYNAREYWRQRPPSPTSPRKYPTSELSVSRQRQCLRSISLWLKAMHAQVKRRLPGQQRQHPAFPLQPLFPPATPFPHTVLDLTDRQHVTRHFNLQRPSLPTSPPPARLDIFDVLISFRSSPWGLNKNPAMFVRRPNNPPKNAYVNSSFRVSPICCSFLVRIPMQSKSLLNLSLSEYKL